jgi:hypothetical protein
MKIDAEETRYRDVDKIHLVSYRVQWRIVENKVMKEELYLLECNAV